MSLLVQTAHKIASFSTLADGDSVPCLNDLSFVTLQWFGDLFWRWGLNGSLDNCCGLPEPVLGGFTMPMDQVLR